MVGRLLGALAIAFLAAGLTAIDAQPGRDLVPFFVAAGVLGLGAMIDGPGFGHVPSLEAPATCL